MPALVFENCLCCDLRTGSLIIGYVVLVMVLLGIYSTTEAVMSHPAGGKMIIKEGDICIMQFPTGLFAGKECGKGFEKSFATAMFALAVVALVIDVVTLAAAVALLFGIHRDQREFVKAFLISYAARICAYLVLLIASIIVARTNDVPISTLITIPIFFLVLIFRVYFLVMVRSYYHS